MLSKKWITQIKMVICICMALLFGYIPEIAIAVAAAPSNDTKQSLALMVKKTLQRHPSILKNSAYRQAANAAVRQARGGFFPKVNTEFAAGRSNTEINYPVITQQNSLNPSMTNLTITQPIFSGLSTYNTVQQRKEEFKAASFSESLSKEDLALQAVYAYMNVLLTNHLHSLYIHNISVHKQILNKVDIKYKGGGGTRADVDLAAGRLAQKVARLRNIEGAQANSVADFLEVVGIMPTKLFLPAEFPSLPENLEATLNMAMEKNPAYFKALADFNAASKAVSVSKSSLMPQINLEFSKTNSHDFSGSEARNNDTRGMLVARYNLFDGGSDISNIDRASCHKQAAMYNLQDTKNKIIERTTKVWNKLKADELSLTENYKHLHAAEKALEAYKLQFELGRNSLLNVLDMENEVFNARTDVVNGQYAVIIDRYELLANTGVLATYFNGKG